MINIVSKGHSLHDREVSRTIKKKEKRAKSKKKREIKRAITILLLLRVYKDSEGEKVFDPSHLRFGCWDDLIGDRKFLVFWL
jgi:cobalamin biosynthesis Co2+ chelatase CbiK